MQTTIDNNVAEEQSFDFTHLAFQPGLICAWELDVERQKIVLLQQSSQEKNNLSTYDLANFLNFVHPNDRDGLLSNIKKAPTVGNSLEIEFRINIAEKIAWLSAHARCTNENKLFGVFINISDRRKNAEFLAQRQSQLANLVRVSSLGEMAAMLSHEISQPLVVINTYIAGCIRRLETNEIDKPSIISAMKKANEHVELAGSFIHRMKNYFKKNGFNFEHVNIHDVIKGAIALLFHERHHLPVTIEYDLDEQLPIIDVDRLQIKFVLLSLLHNSIDAIQESKLKNSKIIIQTRKISDDMLAVNVIDYGCGIPKDLRKKLFNTYCSTKTNGSGLTLIICRGIIEAHNGEINAENYKNNGTKFTFTLPLSIE